MGFTPRQAVQRPGEPRRGGATLRRGGAPRWRHTLRESLSSLLIGWFVPAMRHFLSQPERGAASAVAARAPLSWQLRQEAAWLSLRLAGGPSSIRSPCHRHTHGMEVLTKTTWANKKNKTEGPPVSTHPAPNFSALLHREASRFPFHGAEPMQLS